MHPRRPQGQRRPRTRTTSGRFRPRRPAEPRLACRARCRRPLPCPRTRRGSTCTACPRRARIPRRLRPGRRCRAAPSCRALPPARQPADRPSPSPAGCGRSPPCPRCRSPRRESPRRRPRAHLWPRRPGRRLRGGRRPSRPPHRVGRRTSASGRASRPAPLPRLPTTTAWILVPPRSIPPRMAI